MPSDKTTVATTADFASTVVGGTDRESIASSAARAHDGTSQQPRPEVHPEALNVLLPLDDWDSWLFRRTGNLQTSSPRIIPTFV